MSIAFLTQVQEGYNKEDFPNSLGLEKTKDNNLYYSEKGGIINIFNEIIINTDMNICIAKISDLEGKEFPLEENLLQKTRPVVEYINNQIGKTILYNKVFLARSKNNYLLNDFADRIVQVSFLKPTGGIEELKNREEILNRVERESPIEKFTIYHNGVSIHYNDFFYFNNYNKTDELIDLISKLRKEEVF